MCSKGHITSLSAPLTRTFLKISVLPSLRPTSEIPIGFCFDPSNLSSSLCLSNTNFLYDIKDWIFGVYFPLIEGVSRVEHFHDIHVGGFKIVGKYGGRATFRYFDATHDSIDQTFSPLLYYRRRFGEMDPYSLFTDEYTSTFKNFFPGLETFEWKYHSPGSDHTSNSAGGYSLLFEKSNSSQMNQIYKNWFLSQAPLNALLGLLNFDTIFYSEYYKSYALVKQNFLMKMSGSIKPHTLVMVKIINFLYFLSLELL